MCPNMDELMDRIMKKDHNCKYAIMDRIIEEDHNSKYSIHPCITKIYHNLKDVYWWNSMKMDIKDYVLKYHNCKQVLVKY